MPVPEQQQERVGIVDLISFICELAMLAALAVVGARLFSGIAVRIVLAIVLPAVAIGLWSVWLARNSTRRLDDPLRLILEIILFAAVGAALGIVGCPLWGAIFGVVAIGSFGYISIRDRAN